MPSTMKIECQLYKSLSDKSHTTPMYLMTQVTVSTTMLNPSSCFITYRVWKLGILMSAATRIWKFLLKEFRKYKVNFFDCDRRTVHSWFIMFRSNWMIFIFYKWKYFCKVSGNWRWTISKSFSLKTSQIFRLKKRSRPYVGVVFRHTKFLCRTFTGW